MTFLKFLVILVCQFIFSLMLYPLCMLLCKCVATAKSLQSCLTVRPQRWQPTRLARPWDSPGKNTGESTVGCNFLLQDMKVKSESEVTQSCLTFSDAMDCSLPGSSVHGIFQERVLEWGAIAFCPEPSSKPPFTYVFSF